MKHDPTENWQNPLLRSRCPRPRGVLTCERSGKSLQMEKQMTSPKKDGASISVAKATLEDTLSVMRRW